MSVSSANEDTKRGKKRALKGWLSGRLERGKEDAEGQEGKEEEKENEGEEK